MKKTIFAILASIVALASCVKEKPGDNTPLAQCSDYFETQASSLDLSAQGGDVTLSISSNVHWYVTLNEELYIYERSGLGDAELTISVPSNPTFEERELCFEVTTDAEIRDDSEGSVNGRTDKYVINQKGLEKKFEINASEISVVCIDTKASVLLTETVGYSVSCSPSSVTCSAADVAMGVHSLNFSFPENEGTTDLAYIVTITPNVPALEPLTLTIKHLRNDPIVLDCTNASNFRYGSGVKLPARSTTAPPAEAFEFWLDGLSQYKFYGKAMQWSNLYLNTPANPEADRDIRLPAIADYQLRRVEYTYSHKGSDLTYKILDGEGEVLNSAVVNKYVGAGVKDVLPSDNAERHLTCNTEMSLQFKLYYYPVK